MLRSWSRFHLYVDESVLDYVVVENVNNARMPQLAQHIDETERVASFVIVQCVYIDTRHYFRLLGVHVYKLENFSIALLVEECFELCRKRCRVVGDLIHWFQLLLPEALGVKNGNVLRPSHLLRYAAI